MAKIGFADLVELYRHTTFDDGGGGGVLHVASQRVADAMRAAEADQATYDQTQISLVDADEPLSLGSDVRVNVASPNRCLGELARDFDALFRAPGASFEEPGDYYVIDPGYARGDAPVPEVLSRYRSLLSVIAVLKNAATYVGMLERELVFINDEKIVVPIAFSAADLPALIENDAARLRRLFEDPLHGDEKSGLVSAAVIEAVRGIRRADRFRHLIGSLDQVCDEIEKGYRLFVSSFSYSRIKKEIETARLEYIGKIHKTIVDIQGQLLGIPVATIVVASQLKRSAGCGVAFWTNCAVLLGAWVFVGLLWLAVRNQRHTLDAIGAEVAGQKGRLERDHAAVQDDFLGTFDDLEDRIGWHKTALRIVFVLALAGGLLATAAFLMLTQRGSAACLLPS